MSEKVKDPLKARHYGISAINPFAPCTQISRLLMTASQMGQKLTLTNPEPSMIQSCLEEGLSGNTYSIKVDETIEVIAVVPMVVGPMMSNWKQTIVYRTVGTGELGFIDIDKYHSLHTKFGFEYQMKPAADDIYVGKMIPAGTILADTKSVGGEGEYNIGVHLNTLLISDRGTAEDSAIISTDLDELSYHTYETINFSIGHNQLPLNIYGDDDEYKVLPNPGDYIREDNIIAAVRTIVENNMLPVQAHPKRLKEICHLTDDIYQVQSAFEGTVVSVEVIDNRNKKNFYGTSDKPTSPTYQLEKLANLGTTYLSTIFDIYTREKLRAKKNGTTLRISHELQNLVQHAYIMTTASKRNKRRVKISAKRAELKAFTISIVIKKTPNISLGGKLADIFAAKSVVTEKRKPEHMPVDASGRRADIILSHDATIGRTIIGRTHSHYINHVLAEEGKYIREQLGITDRKDPMLEADARGFIDDNPHVLKSIIQRLRELFTLINPIIVESIDMYPEEHIGMIVYFAKHNVIAPLPVDVVTQKSPIDIINGLRASKFNPCFGPIVTLKDDGTHETSEADFRIAPLYYILLEKDATEISSTCTMRLQPMGLPGVKTKKDKYTNTISKSNPAVAGIDETAILSSILKVEDMFELMDRMNNPMTLMHMYDQIMSTDKPTDLHSLVDRPQIGYGKSRPVALIAHVLQCFGAELYYKPYKEDRK